VGPRAGLDTQLRGRILLPLPGIEPQSSGRPARSQTLYCLSYPGSLLGLYIPKSGFIASHKATSDLDKAGRCAGHALKLLSGPHFESWPGYWLSYVSFSSVFLPCAGIVP
jgi:hypothetical protein